MKLLLSVVSLLAPTTFFRQTGDARRLLGVSVIISLIFSGVWISSAFSSDRPNVLLIISDDQGYGEFGFTGNKLVKTPNLDQLANESAVFRNFVVAPACSPSRSAIFTGRNHLLTGVWGVPPRANLRRDETMMPAFFEAAGYNTLFVGKMDCSQPYQTLAWEVGWDDAVGGASGYDHRDPIITRKAGKETIDGWTAEIWTENAIRFIREKKDQPWLLSVAYIIPHMPWEPADERHAPHFRALGCSDLLAANLSHIAQMDASIGRLLDALRKTGQEHRTLVVFVSDNGQTGPKVKRVSDDGHVPGEDWAKKNVANLRGHKSTPWENGIRVPLLVRWSGQIRPGDRAQFGCAEDIVPTLLDVAGIQDDVVAHQQFTGVSLRPALENSVTTFQRAEAFRMTIWGPGMPNAPRGIVPDADNLMYDDHHLVLRGQRFKYHALPGGGSALYDLETDLGETRDVQEMFANMTSQMAMECRRRWDAVIASGRAFRMPTILIGSEAAEAPSNSRSRLSCTAANSITGKMRIQHEAVGFATAGDSASFTPVDRASPEETNAMMQPRLTAGSNATVLLDGKPFRVIGVNYFDCFLRTLHDGDDTSYDAGFATLATKGIPFVRFAATGFWPSDMKLYIENRDECFRRLDGVVHSAEKHGIGLVPSLFWYYACVPDLVGEPMDQWANPQSKTQAWMRRYVEEVVTRYKNSPAIWMWEMGNEYSLAASLPNAKQHRAQTAIKLGTPATRSERDELTFAMVRQVFAAFAREVLKYDPHRLVSTGDSMLRPSVWHQEREGAWTRDTPDQYAEMLALANPDPGSAISLHAYDDAHNRFPSSRKASLRMNKPIFLGEFGVQGETPESAEKLRGMLAAITENRIPLAALWVFDYARQPKFNITATNARGWQLEAIADANTLLHQPRSTNRD